MTQIGKTYYKRIDVGYNGQASRVFEAFMAVTSEIVKTGTTLGVAVPVKLTSGQVEMATASGDTVYGFSLRAFPSQERSWGAGNETFSSSQVWAGDQPVPIMKRGYFTAYVQSGTPTKGGSVYRRTAVLGNLAVGGLETGTAAKGVMAAASGNTGNGTAVLTSTPADAVAGTVTVTFTSATAFGFTYGGIAYTGTTGSTFSGGGFVFTITAGATAFVSGDKFTITLTTDTNVAIITGAVFTGGKSSDGISEVAYNI